MTTLAIGDKVYTVKIHDAAKPDVVGGNLYRNDDKTNQPRLANR
jgi:hypothetical protein